MNVWAFVGGMLMAVLSLLYGFKLTFVGVTQATAKGYRHMIGLGVGLFLLLCGAFAWSAALVVQRISWFAGMTSIFVAFLIASPSAGLTVLLMTPLLRNRASRGTPASKANLPFRLLGTLLLVLGPAAAVFCYTTGVVKGTTPLKFVTLSITCGVALLGLARKSRLPSARDVLSKDPRTPVLYLRAFSREKDVFAKATNDGQEFADRPNAERLYRTVEEFLGREINRDAGPFVALGSPLDYVPPDGAARLYSEDDGWQKDFLNIGEKAQMIILLPNYSANLEFELRSAREAGWVHKIRVITRPELPLTKWERRRWKLAAWIGGPLVAQRIAPHDWPAFVRGLAAAGFPASEDAMQPPPQGSVLTFAADGRLRVFRQALRTPDEFVCALCGAQGSEITEAAAVARSTGGRSRAAGKVSPRSVVLGAGAAAVVIVSFVANAKSAALYFEKGEEESRTFRTLAAIPSERPVLMVHDGRPLYPGMRIRTRRGAGVFAETGSMAVIIGAGQTGVVNGLARGTPRVVVVEWDPQTWEADSWVSTWGIPGFYRKRLVRLPAFVASINADWIEIAQ